MGKIRSFWHAVGILCRAEGCLSGNAMPSNCESFGFWRCNTPL